MIIAVFLPLGKRRCSGSRWSRWPCLAVPLNNDLPFKSVESRSRTLKTIEDVVVSDHRQKREIATDEGHWQVSSVAW